MVFEKLERGLLQMMTEDGPIYAVPSLIGRIYLMWIFRHFTRLPHRALSKKARKSIDALMSGARCSVGFDDPCVIGTVELYCEADLKHTAPLSAGGLAWGKP